MGGRRLTEDAVVSIAQVRGVYGLLFSFAEEGGDAKLKTMQVRGEKRGKE